MAAARNRAATSSVYGTSPVLRHNWNSMTATTRGRESRTMATPGGIGWTAGEGFKTVGRRSTTSARSDPLRFFFASFARNIDRGNRAINRASYRVQNMMMRKICPGDGWIWKIGGRCFDYPLTGIILIMRSGSSSRSAAAEQLPCTTIIAHPSARIINVVVGAVHDDGPRCDANFTHSACGDLSRSVHPRGRGRAGPRNLQPFTRGIKKKLP